MHKILFVCLGNICRSPMAEFIMKQMVNERGLEKSFYIESAATSSYEIGNPIYPPAKRVLENRGIKCSNKRARRITMGDYGKFDYIVCMDSENLEDLKDMFRPDSQNKISKILSFAGIDRDVADPWYTRNFQATEKDVELGCQALLRHIISKYETVI
ncbi:MAG: low molecular weight phosphotyrosine protein phosphatase [Ruminococcaceae bacterium]|nr:low molecular weight phosphotyrosine protein phosphatase [Oscillospiraceae bacterium]